MIIELGDNGLRDRYHWSSYDIDDGEIRSYLADSSLYRDLAAELFRANDRGTVQAIAACLAVRSICPFLTDDNHEWEARDYGPPQSAHHERLRELQASSRYSITLREKISTEGVRYWFHFAYRVPGQPD